MLRLLALILIISPAFTFAADPCTDLESNFLGKFNLSMTESGNPNQNSVVEVIRWDYGQTWMYTYVNGVRDDSVNIVFGQSYSSGHPVCILQLNGMLLTNNLADVQSGHFTFVGLDSQTSKPVSADFRRLPAGANLKTLSYHH